MMKFLKKASLTVLLTCILIISSLMPLLFLESIPMADAAPWRDTIKGDTELMEAYQTGVSDLIAEGVGQVTRLLADDLEGSRHQRFIVRLRSGQTLLVSHNIDVAPRIDALRVGDEVRFRGEYEWSERGGILHWTHDDPKDWHADGWLLHNGVRYD